jgi:hypothetical protein
VISSSSLLVSNVIVMVKGAGSAGSTLTAREAPLTLLK